MTHLIFNPDLLSTLEGKVVVLTGGATGIGREAVKQIHEAKANLIFGDVNDAAATSLLTSLSSPPNIRYQHCDTTSYTSQLALFRTAYNLWGRINIVIANAGVSIPQDPFDFSNSSEEWIENEPSTLELEVNLKGVLYTSRIGMFYLRKNKIEGGDLILVSSIAGFKDSTGLTTYTASKHGVVGIMRGLRVQAEREGVRINVVCPWMTKTGMVAGIEKGWRELSLPENTPASVARSMVLLATASRGRKKYDKQSLTTSKVMHSGTEHAFDGLLRSPAGRSRFEKSYWGKVLFVAGGESYEIEDAFDRLEPEWLGKDNSRVLAIGQEFLMNGETSWDTEKVKAKL